MHAARAIQSARLGCPGTNYSGLDQHRAFGGPVSPPDSAAIPESLTGSPPVPSPGEPPLPGTHSAATGYSPHRYHFGLLNTACPSSRPEVSISPKRFATITRPPTCVPAALAPIFQVFIPMPGSLRRTPREHSPSRAHFSGHPPIDAPKVANAQ